MEKQIPYLESSLNEERITLAIPVETKARLMRLKKEGKVNYSELIRQWIEENLPQIERQVFEEGA